MLKWLSHTELFPWVVLNSVNFGCFVPSRFQCNAMRKAIKAHKSWQTIQQNEHTNSILEKIDTNLLHVGKHRSFVKNNFWN